LQKSFFNQFYMNFSFSRLFALVAVVGVLFSSCKKSSDPAPTYGSATIDGATYTWTVSGTNTSAGVFTLYAATDTNAATGSAIGVGQITRPTVSSQDTLGGPKGLVVVYSQQTASGFVERYFRKSKEKVTTTVTGGKITYSFSNLTETDSLGGAKANPKSLSGSVIEK
jgi:hypothetical protein